MTHSEFVIGGLFVCNDRVWQCTDIGTRTVIAIGMDPDKTPDWYRGPPYAVAEMVFDENDLPACRPF